MKKARNIPVGVKITTDNKCGFCTNSKCCTYITEELVTPRSMHDFDHLLWQLSHRDIQAYKDEDGWYLLINNSCTHLQKDGRCGIYDDRPLICREYTNDYCERLRAVLRGLRGPAEIRQETLQDLAQVRGEPRPAAGACVRREKKNGH